MGCRAANCRPARTGRAFPAAARRHPQDLPAVDQSARIARLRRALPQHAAARGVGTESTRPGSAGAGSRAAAGGGGPHAVRDEAPGREDLPITAKKREVARMRFCVGSCLARALSGSRIGPDAVASVVSQSPPSQPSPLSPKSSVISPFFPSSQSSVCPESPDAPDINIRNLTPMTPHSPG